MQCLQFIWNYFDSLFGCFFVYVFVLLKLNFEPEVPTEDFLDINDYNTLVDLYDLENCSD